MVNLYLIIATLLANIISIGVVYQFIKKLEKRQKLLFIAISVAFMYIITSIIYWVSGFGIEKIIHESSKNFIIYLFVPVNVIIFIPYFAAQYMKFKLKKIKAEKFANRVSILFIILIILLIVECFYFRNIQSNIKMVNDAKNENANTQLENEISNNEIVNEEKTNNTINNEITNNEVVNSNIKNNETSDNKITNNEIQNSKTSNNEINRNKITSNEI